MKKICILFVIALFLSACSGELGGRIDQIVEIPVPGAISVKSVRSIAGGAVIKVTIPDDENLKGIVAEYERNGQTVNAKISRYVDSLTVEGFADTKPHTIMLYAFNVNEQRSEGVSVTVNPLTPAIETVVPDMIGSFGGVKITIRGNESRSALAVCLLRDVDLSDLGKPLSQMKWEEVTTLFTSSNDIRLSRRGIDPVEAIFGVYIRDHWGNMSDTTVAVLKPIKEIQLDKSKFKNAAIADDNCPSQNATNYPISSLWDGSGQSAVPHFFASDPGNPSPCWLTIDLGVEAQLSRVATLPRIGYVIYGGGAVRDYEFWGSLAPTGTINKENEHNFDDTWFCLGKFVQAKPSGYDENGLPGTVTSEDSQTFNAGNDFEFDKEQYPRCNDPLRYLRVVFANTFTTYEYGHNTSNRQVQTGEITPYGFVEDE